jgi:hypothetical protein
MIWRMSANDRPPVRPLFFEFDDAKYFAVEEQFMVGPSLLITPVLHEGKAAVTGYFPSSGQTTWRDWTTGEVRISIHHPKLQGIFIDDQVVKPNSKGQAELLTPLGKINVHIRSGSVILIHDKPAYSLTETRESPYGLVIHLDAKGEAKGEAVLDDGLSIDGKSLVFIHLTAEKLTARFGDIHQLYSVRQEANDLLRWRVQAGPGYNQSHRIWGRRRANGGRRCGAGECELARSHEYFDCRGSAACFERGEHAQVGVGVYE